METFHCEKKKLLYHLIQFVPRLLIFTAPILERYDQKVI